MAGKDYVHGYSEREKVRLYDQANTLDELLHGDTRYAAGSHVLEAGCGAGAQTIILARNNPDSRFTSVDISAESIVHAKELVEGAGICNVEFRQADIFNLPFEEESFDHVFLCFVLEHLPYPVDALKRLKSMLKPGGTMTVIEGDHGSTYFYPRSEAASKAVQCQVDIQARMGGNALIGRELYPLIRSAGFEDVRVSPRMVYVDDSRPEWVEGFTRNTFTAMIEGVGPKAIEMGLTDPASFQQGVADLYATANGGGVFCYTFFKAVAVKSP
jgi:SAM-dependent methyltransferase